MTLANQDHKAAPSMTLLVKELRIEATSGQRTYAEYIWMKPQKPGIEHQSSACTLQRLAARSRTWRGRAGGGVQTAPVRAHLALPPPVHHAHAQNSERREGAEEDRMREVAIGQQMRPGPEGEREKQRMARHAHDPGARRIEAVIARAAE